MPPSGPTDGVHLSAVMKSRALMDIAWFSTKRANHFVILKGPGLWAAYHVTFPCCLVSTPVRKYGNLIAR